MGGYWIHKSIASREWVRIGPQINYAIRWWFIVWQKYYLNSLTLARGLSENLARDRLARKCSLLVNIMKRPIGAIKFGVGFEEGVCT